MIDIPKMLIVTPEIKIGQYHEEGLEDRKEEADRVEELNAFLDGGEDRPGAEPSCDQRKHHKEGGDHEQDGPVGSGREGFQKEEQNDSGKSHGKCINNA